MGLGKGSKQTTTTKIDPKTQSYVDYMRGAGRGVNETALGSEPWAQPMSPLFGQGLEQLNAAGQLGMGLGGIGAGMIGAALPGALAQGLGGLGGYANPYAAQMIGSAIPGYQYNRQLANQAAGQMATQQGAYGGSREAILRAEQMGQIDRGFQEMVGQAAGQGTQMGMNAMMQDRARLAGMLPLGFGSISQQQQILQQLAGQYQGMGEYQRQVAQQQAMDPYTRAAAGAGMLPTTLGPYGTTSVQQQSGNLFKDLMGLGMVAAAPFTGGKSLAGLPGVMTPQPSPPIPITQSTFSSPSVYDYNVPGARPVPNYPYPGGG